MSGKTTDIDPRESAIIKVKEEFQRDYQIHEITRRTPKTKKVRGTAPICKYDYGYIILNIVDRFHFHLKAILKDRNQIDQMTDAENQAQKLADEALAKEEARKNKRIVADIIRALEWFEI